MRQSFELANRKFSWYCNSVSLWKLMIIMTGKPRFNRCIAFCEEMVKYFLFHIQWFRIVLISTWRIPTISHSMWLTFAFDLEYDIEAEWATTTMFVNDQVYMTHNSSMWWTTAPRSTMCEIEFFVNFALSLSKYSFRLYVKTLGPGCTVHIHMSDENRIICSSTEMRSETGFVHIITSHPETMENNYTFSRCLYCRFDWVYCALVTYSPRNR